MEPISTVSGRAYPLGLKNIDTDVIIPAYYLKTISRTGLGRGAFETLRAQPGNVFDDPRYAGAPILVAGDNFGCGPRDRKSVGEGKSVSIRVALGGRRIIKKKINSDNSDMTHKLDVRQINVYHN